MHTFNRMCNAEFSKAGKGSPTRLSQIQTVPRPIAVIIDDYVSVGECGGGREEEGARAPSAPLFPCLCSGLCMRAHKPSLCNWVT